MVVGGYGNEVSQIAIRSAKRLATDGKATILMDGHKGRAIDCVIANSVLAHSFLQDDWHPVSHSHIGVAVIPAVLAIAQEFGKSGADALLATVVGYEVEGRCGVLSVPTFTRGFRASSVYSYFGSASASAKLLGLTAEQFRNALACAGCMAGGILQPWIDGSMEWALAEAFGCRGGILASVLAQEGLRGADNILEGPCGVNQCFAGTIEGKEEALKGLGKNYQILDVCFKRFPSGGANQGSIAVALDLVQRHKIDYRKIRAVRVKVPHAGTHERMNYAGISYQGPFYSLDQCLISKPFGIAATLKNAVLNIDIVRRQRDDPEIAELAQKIHLQEKKGVSGWSLLMEIELEDGTVLHGDGANIDQRHIYLNRDLAVDKFEEMAIDKLGADRAEQIVDLVFNMEDLKSIFPVVDRMTLK
jgi:2-methylcitrate dehydratase PrpD